MSDAFSGLLEGLTEGGTTGLNLRRRRDLDREGVRRRRRQDEIADMILANQMRNQEISMRERGYQVRPSRVPRLNQDFGSFGPGPAPSAPQPTFAKPSGMRTLDAGPGDKGRRFTTLPNIPSAIQGPGPGGPGGQAVPDIDPRRGIEFGGDLEYVGSPELQGRLARSRAIGDLIGRLSGRPVDDVTSESIARGEVDPSLLFRESPEERHRRTLEVIRERSKYPSRSYRPAAPKTFGPDEIRGALEIVGERYPGITDPDEQMRAAVSILRGQTPARTRGSANFQDQGPPVPEDGGGGGGEEGGGTEGPGWLSRVYDKMMSFGGRMPVPTPYGTFTFDRGGQQAQPDSTGAPGEYPGPHTRSGITTGPEYNEEVEGMIGEDQEVAERQQRLDDLAVELADYTHLGAEQLRAILASEELSPEEIEYVLSQLGPPDDNEP